MKIGMVKKQAAIVCLAAAAAACLVWLACSFSAASGNAPVIPPPGGKDAGNRARVSSEFVTRASGAPRSAKTLGEQDNQPGNPAAEHRAEESGGSPDCHADEEKIFSGHRAGEEGEAAEDAAELKERLVRERFGVVLRQGKWIPTEGGGSNLVYIATGSLPPGRVGETYEVGFEAVSGAPPYKWSIIGGGLPRGFSLDAGSGKLRAIPVEPITTYFLLGVADSMGARDVAEYVLTIEPEQSLEIVTENLPAAFPGEDYFVRLQANGGIPPYWWSAAGDTDEIGALIIDPHTGELYGNISPLSPELDIPLVLRVGDAQREVSKELVLHVRTRLSILELPPVSVRESDGFEFLFRATGGMEPYAWSHIGRLPPGLELSAEGLFSGEPSEPGIYEIGVWVRDEADQVDAAQFALEVKPAPADCVSNFEALLSRNSVALGWNLPAARGDIGVRIVRNSTEKPATPADGITVYRGRGTSYLDRDVGEGDHYYTAFLEENGTVVTSAAPPTVYAKLPPETDPFADKVVSANLLHPAAFGSDKLPDIVLGPPTGAGIERGSLNVVSLGAATNDDGGASAPYGGSITLMFTDNVVWNGPGADFTVFENVFYIHNKDGVPDPETRYMEPAVVSVSQDGIDWRQFKFDFSPRYHPDTGALNLRHPYTYNTGFAGINPVMSNGFDPDPTDPEVSGGDSFDLSDVGLDWIRYVHIQSTGNRWLADEDGDLVHHTEDFGAASRNVSSSGFDLDAVTAIWMKKVVGE